jgi:hypothetical protein
MRQVAVVVAVLAVIGAIGGGLYFIGPPAEERARRLDAHRESDLERLRGAADLYWTRYGRLPPSLDQLDSEAGIRVFSRDPETGDAYGYALKSTNSYELCAEFARESESRGEFWWHGPGRRCFQITAQGVRR